MADPKHEGYEYQDYFTVLIILELILHHTDAEIIVDKKDFEGDKFDDLKVITDNGITEYQIKYSDDKKQHKLTKDDFSNGNKHDTALSDLFASWKKRRTTISDSKIKLCLAWDRSTPEDKILKFLKPISDESFPFPNIAYLFDGKKLWPEGKLPPKQWKKFNGEIEEGKINREEFISFCDELTIILEMPKASLNLDNPGPIEKVLITQVEKLGIGIYPNNNLKVEDVINKLASKVKHSRAIGDILNTSQLLAQLGLIMDYGKIDQKFPIDLKHHIKLNDEIIRLEKVINDSKHVIVRGNPGSGKSWLIDEFISKLMDEGKKVIRYNCFQSLQDTNNIDRIRTSSFYGNLVSQIVDQYPELSYQKITRFGADKEEFENLLFKVKENFYLVVDGLDHISREYELNKDVITQSETEIISELLEIQYPDNCCVIISAQPIDELEKFKKNNYKVFDIEPWGLEQIRSLMHTFHISDNRIGCDTNSLLSDYLLKKSQGNALYISYILKELENTNISKELIEDIPDYDMNLFDYYSYLYTKVHNNKTVNAFCAADFYLSLEDLIEITGDGDYVYEDISLLHPLLIGNESNGGYSIYHESFRRFVLDSLAHKNINIEKNVYGLLVDWLQEKQFFEFDKSFYFLTRLLYKSKKDNENIALLDTEFVRKSISEGYSRKRIRMNLNCIVRSAGRARDLVSLVTAGELLAMLNDLNDFESAGKEYLQAICDIKGANKLNQLMQIDGKPTFNVNEGLTACYISSKAGSKTWWKLYLDPEVTKYSVENYKYYIRCIIDEKGTCVVPELMNCLERQDKSIINQCIETAYNELIDYMEFDEIVLIADDQNLINWRNYLSYIETGYYLCDEIGFENVKEGLEKIKEIKIPNENDIKIYRDFFSQIYYLAKHENSSAIETICDECKNINWYYNWIMYSVKMAELYACKEDMDSKSICESVISNLRLLINDTNIFKGQTCACDLYHLKNELFNSYKKALNLIKQYGGVNDLITVLGILETLTKDTSARLGHSSVGPLTNVEFLKLISHYMTADNYENVKPYLFRIQKRIENTEVYDDIAVSKLLFACIIYKYNQIAGLHHYNEGISYLVAYRYHKAIILEQILESYHVFYKLVEGKTEKERDSITKMTFTVLTHTDRRVTRHFLNIWFDILLKTDSSYALAFLSSQLLDQGRNWVHDEMIRSVIQKCCNNPKYVDIIIGLIESLPNDISTCIINAATSALDILNHMLIEADEHKRQLIKRRMNELVINILSRFDILDEPWIKSHSMKNESIERFISLADSVGIDVSQYIEYFNIKNTENFNEEETEKIDDIFDNQPHFYAVTIEDAIKWFENNDLYEKDISNICVFIKNYQNDRNIFIGLLITIIAHAYKYRTTQKRKNNLLILIKQLELDNDTLAEVHMLMYIYSNDGLSYFIDKEEFINSMQLNRKVAEETFYRESSEVIIKYSGRITKGILNTLLTFEFDENKMIEIWRNAFEIMKLRFPNLDLYPDENILIETNELSLLRNVLLMRFNDGGKESFLSTFAYIADCAEEKNYLEFTECILFCLNNFSEYNLVTQLGIADLIRYYGNCLEDSEKKRITDAIDDIYPTGNMLLDVIFSVFTIYKSFLSQCSDKDTPNYKRNEDVEFYLAEQLYDLGEENSNSIPDKCAEYAVYRDPIMYFLKVCGIDYVELYNKLHKSELLNNKTCHYVNVLGGANKSNTVYKSYAIQYALHLIIKKAYLEEKFELIEQCMIYLIPDYQGMYRLFKCCEMQPQNHLYEKENTCKNFLYKSETDEYVRIGCTEIKVYDGSEQISITFAYEGLVKKKIESTIIPFAEYKTVNIEKDAIYPVSEDSTLLFNLIKTYDQELETNTYLWPGKIVSDIFNIHMDFDFLNGRYVGIDQKGNVVFIMRKWYSSYIQNYGSSIDSIPLYNGTELFIKKDYLYLLEKRFGTLMMKTYVEKY